MIEISVAATSRALLTQAQLRTAAGVTDGSRDTELAGIGLTIADIISRWCKIAGDGVTPVTLLQETLIETFYPRERNERLILGRRFLGAVGVVEDGVALVENTDFTVEKGSGILTRRYDNRTRRWCGRGMIVVTYQAGFDEVPTDLADVASEMVARRTGAARDPLLTRERIDIPGVRLSDRQYLVDAADSVDITLDLAERLSPYRSVVVG